MRRHDAELEEMRAGISCAVVIERLSAGWLLDKQQSTRNCLKYRRASEILIVNNDGKGWWDPGRSGADPDGKGDVFQLVQHLQPGTNFGHVRKTLRSLIGLRPTLPPMSGRAEKNAPHVPPAEAWARRPRLRRGSATWAYLASERKLPAEVLVAAAQADNLREGPKGSAWFAHRDHAGDVTGIEMRGPDWRGFSAGGEKTLFRLRSRQKEPVHRLVVTEAPIDALSIAALEGLRPDSLYVSVAGGMGPHTIVALRTLIGLLPPLGKGVLIAATDADEPGDKYARQMADLAGAGEVRTLRKLPPDKLKDWNDAIRARAKGETP